LVRFVWSGVEGGFDAMGQLPGAGWVLGALLVVGLVLAWGRLGWAGARTEAAAPAALLVGAFLFLGFSGLVRAGDFGTAYARESRYLYLFVALVLPALAVAADAVARRWRALAPAVLVLLLIGIPGNIDALLDERRAGAGFHSQYRTLILTLPRVPFAHEAPRSLRPEPRYAKRLTLGWLLDETAAGRIPEPANSTPADEATATLHLALQQQPGPPRTTSCRNATTPVGLRLAASEAISMRGIIQIVYITPGGARSRPVTFDPSNFVVTPRGAFPGRRLVALTGPLTLRVTSENPNATVALCI
ncbi:MAG: hypothetical protein ACRDY6_03385, partial [Acidimicrobiia bacterium]